MWTATTGICSSHSISHDFFTVCLNDPFKPSHGIITTVYDAPKYNIVIYSRTFLTERRYCIKKQTEVKETSSYKIVIFINWMAQGVYRLWTFAKKCSHLKNLPIWNSSPFSLLFSSSPFSLLILPCLPSPYLLFSFSLLIFRVISLLPTRCHGSPSWIMKLPY